MTASHDQGRGQHVIVTILHSVHGAASSPSSGPRAPAGDRVALDPAPLCAGAAGGCRGADRGAVGRGLLGDGELIMSAALAFDDLTLGYDRHPAVHHLRGEVKSGALMAVA